MAKRKRSTITSCFGLVPISKRTREDDLRSQIRSHQSSSTAYRHKNGKNKVTLYTGDSGTHKGYFRTGG